MTLRRVPYKGAALGHASRIDHKSLVTLQFVAKNEVEETHEFRSGKLSQSFARIWDTCIMGTFGSSNVSVAGGH